MAKKEVLNYSFMLVQKTHKREKESWYISGSCSRGYSKEYRAVITEKYSMYLCGRKLSYLKMLIKKKGFERTCEYLTKLLNTVDDY